MGNTNVFRGKSDDNFHYYSVAIDYDVTEAYREQQAAMPIQIPAAAYAEYEANLVAAAILLPTDEVLDYIYSYHYDAAQIARAMRTDVNLVALKIAALREQGYDLRKPEHDSAFLK